MAGQCCSSRFLARPCWAATCSLLPYPEPALVPEVRVLAEASYGTRY